MEKWIPIIAEISEDELSESDILEFSRIYSAIESEAQYCEIEGGQAIRQTTAKDGTRQLITAKYPLESGNRYVMYHIQLVGDDTKLVKKVILQHYQS